MAKPTPHYANGTSAPWDSGYFGPDGKPKPLPADQQEGAVDGWDALNAD